jgi:polar amino acid transport system substrate-binding protein
MHYRYSQIFMRKKWLLINGLCAVVFCMPSVSVADTLILMADYWYPINAGPMSTREGFGVDLMRGIFKEKNIQIDYRIAPWKRSIFEVERGTADCIIGADPEEAPNLLYPAEPITMEVNAVYHLAGSGLVYQNLDSLLHWRIGLATGYSYGDAFDDFVKKHPNPAMLQYVAGDTPLDVNLKKLLARRVDIVVESDIVMQATLDKKKLKNKVALLALISEKSGLYIGCSPNKKTTQQYLQWWDEGIRAWRLNGKLAAVLDRYGIKQ